MDSTLAVKLSLNIESFINCQIINFNNVTLSNYFNLTFTEETFLGKQKEEKRVRATKTSVKITSSTLPCISYESPGGKWERTLDPSIPSHQNVWCCWSTNEQFVIYPLSNSGKYIGNILLLRKIWKYFIGNLSLSSLTECSLFHLT